MLLITLSLLTSLDEVDTVTIKNTKIMKQIAFCLPGLFCFFFTTAQQKNNAAEIKSSGRLWGLAYIDYAVKVHADSLKRGSTQYSNIPKNFSSFDLRRVYLGYDYTFNEKFSAELLLAHEGNYDAAGNRTVFIKAANLRWKNIYKYADLVAGQMSTPTYSLMMEKIWGYRSIEKTIADMRRIGVSNDVGIALQGRFDSAGVVGYNVMVGNGAASKPETDLFKKFYLNLYAKLFKQHLIIDLNGDYERIQNAPFHKNKSTVKLGVAWQQPQFTIGAEAFSQFQQNFYAVKKTPTAPDENMDAAATGLSFFAKGSIKKDKLNYFIRYDSYNPDSKFNTGYTYATAYPSSKESFVTAGIDFMPYKSIHIMPNVWYNHYHDKRNNATSFQKGDYDLAARCTLFVVFGK